MVNIITWPQTSLLLYWIRIIKIKGKEDEIQKKVYKNSKREYKVINGVNTRVKEYEEKEER